MEELVDESEKRGTGGLRGHGARARGSKMVVLSFDNKVSGRLIQDPSMDERQRVVCAGVGTSLLASYISFLAPRSPVGDEWRADTHDCGYILTSILCCVALPHE